MTLLLLNIIKLIIIIINPINHLNKHNHDTSNSPIIINSGMNQYIKNMTTSALTHTATQFHSSTHAHLHTYHLTHSQFVSRGWDGSSRRMRRISHCKREMATTLMIHICVTLAHFPIAQRLWLDTIDHNTFHLSTAKKGKNCTKNTGNNTSLKL